jgi:hypothetical protein
MALRGKTLNEAKGMIAACEDSELLMAWYQNDVRKGVHTALEARMRVLEPDGEEDGG